MLPASLGSGSIPFFPRVLADRPPFRRSVDARDFRRARDAPEGHLSLCINGLLILYLVFAISVTTRYGSTITKRRSDSVGGSRAAPATPEPVKDLEYRASSGAPTAGSEGDDGGNAPASSTRERHRVIVRTQPVDETLDIGS